MAYQSEYTGKQMEEAFRIMDTIVIGTATLRCNTDGYAYHTIPNVSGRKNISYKCFANVNLPTLNTNSVSSSASYTAATDTLTIQIYGSNIKTNVSYKVDYLLLG